MDKKKEFKTLCPPTSVQGHIQQILKQNNSLSGQLSEELETIVATLVALPFKDELQRGIFLEQVQKLQGYHIIQIFNLAVAPCRNSVVESSIHFGQNFKKLVDICILFCYTYDVSKRVAFYYYTSALQFCFPSDTNLKCLSLGVLSNLLKLVQIFQDGKLKASADSYYDDNFILLGKHNYTKDFFSRLLQVLDSRRNEDYLVEVIDITVRLASVDDKDVIKSNDHVSALREGQTVSSFLVTNWMKLLESANVSNAFACALAAVDLSGEKIEPLGVGFQYSAPTLPCQSTIFYFLGVLEEMKRKADNLRMPNDKTRMDILLNHVDHFCIHPNVAALSLQLLAAITISNDVLREVLDGFFHKERTESRFLEAALALLLKGLLLCPNGELLNKVMNFWIKAFSDDQGYGNLACLLALLDEGSSSNTETAESVLNFLEQLPRTLLPSMMVWRNVLWWLTKIFPTSFHLRQEVLVLIEKTSAAAAGLPVERHWLERPPYGLVPTLQFLGRVYHQNCTEEAKSEMIRLLTYCTLNETTSNSWAPSSDLDLVEFLSVCEQLPFNIKKHLLCDSNPSLRRQLKTLWNEFSTKTRSSQNHMCKGEILNEVLSIIMTFSAEEGSATIPEDILEALLSLSRLPLSGERKLRIIKCLSNKSETNYKIVLYILRLMQTQACVLQEETNEYFDLFWHAVLDALKGDHLSCEQLLSSLHSTTQFPSTNVLKVWTFTASGLISLGLYKEDIDVKVCRSVLSMAKGFGSPYEILQLFSLTRSTALRLACLSRSQTEACSSLNAQESFKGCSTKNFDLLEMLARAAGAILHFNIFSTMNKLVLIQKMCNITLSSPPTMATLTSAMHHLLPFFQVSLGKGSVSSHEEIHLLNQVIDILHDSALLNKLARMPTAVRRDLSSAFSVKFSSVSSITDGLKILVLISSMQDLAQAFFDHLGPFIKVAIEKMSSLKGVLDVFEELVHVIRNVRPELIPFTMLNVSFLLGNPVDQQEKHKFLSEVSARWKIPPSYQILSYFEVPRLLWKIYNFSNDSSRTGELMKRLREILRKISADRFHSEWHFGCHHIIPMKRGIACCELEWLVFYSAISEEDAGLALDLSNRFFQVSSGRQARCLNFSDVRIEDGLFKFKPYEDETPSGVRSKGLYATPVVKVESIPTDKKVGEAILTPVLMAVQVIYHFKRLVVHKNQLHENSWAFWKLIFESEKQFRCAKGCKLSVDDFMHSFLSILAEAPSLEIVFHWAKQHDQFCPHCCSKVIVEACKVHRNDLDKETAFNFHTLVSETLSKMQMPRFLYFRRLKPSFEQLHRFLEKQLHIKVISGVLELYKINIQAGDTVGEIVSVWSSIEQSLELVREIRLLCEKGVMSSLNRLQSEFILQLLESFAHRCKNSSGDLLTRLKKLHELYDQLRDDPYGLTNLPKWRQTTITDGFSARAVDSWCQAFLLTPLKDLKSHDVEAIFSLSSRSLQLANVDSTSLQINTPLPEMIKRVIFPDDGFQVSDGEGIKTGETNERIRLARLLSEFVNILRPLQPEKNLKDANVRELVLDACQRFCVSYENKEEGIKHLYKIHNQTLKSLLTEIFGKGTSLRKGTDEPRRDAMSVASQACFLQEYFPAALRYKEVHESLLILLRRWLTGIFTKPTLVSHTRNILQPLLSHQSSDDSNDDPTLVERLLVTIQGCILSIERNQSLIAQFQAVGYNQREPDSPDLWSSPKIELPCYLSERKSPNDTISDVLRSHWNEWKDLLSIYHVEFVQVGDVKVQRHDLFGAQATLEEMEEQVTAVKECARQLSSELFSQDSFHSAGELDRRIEQLIRGEKQHRMANEKLCKSKRDFEMKKFVAVWENQFFEQVTLCSERIPGCYAPNGFHAEKPVICALSVDNRILTVFKEEKGRREEIENVEVKLFEPGLYVYGLHTSGHEYVTDELWAAFYKMLLEKRLVPRIVLSNESPGFNWTKNFAQPATSLPYPRKWDLHEGIVPEKEDYFDYLPLYAALGNRVSGLTEFVTLTTENVSSFQFKDLKDPNIVENQEKKSKQMIGEAIKQLKHELQILHGEDEPTKRTLAGRLAVLVRKTVNGIVDGVHPTIQMVDQHIDMNKLAFRRPEVDRSDEGRQQYAAAVLRACEHARLIFTSSAGQ